MAGCKPGSAGTKGCPPIDKGTLPLNTMTHPRSLGLAPLILDDSLLQTSLHTLFRSTIQEALRRGAKIGDLQFLRRKYLWMRHTEAVGKIVGDGELAALAPAADFDEESWTKTVVEEESLRFDWIIDEELEKISKGHWEASFHKEIQGNAEVPAGQYPGPVADADDYRYKIRPLYYSHGYTDPADFLSEQVEYSLLGKAKLKTWIHSDLKEILDKTPGVLNGWTAGLAEQTAKGIESVNGLQIREVKGRNVLSNHAFGCAIDVNALGNPHVVGPAVIEVFNSVTREAGVPFDFGKPILTKQERGHANYTADDIMEVRNRAIPASDAVKAWLQTNLPRYRKIMAQVQIAEKELGIKHVKAETTLAERLKNASAAADRLRHERQKKKPVFVRTESNLGSEPPPDDDPEGAALEEIEQAFAAITSDRDLSRIQVLYENFDAGYIDTWEKQGVMSIPLYFAAAMVGELGLQWGEQYEGSKDAMHFELVDHVPANDPLSKGEKPRTLKRLLDESFHSRIPRFQLTTP
jgi:hypothetical protein